MIHEAGWRYMLYYLVMCIASLTMLHSVVRSFAVQRRELLSDLALAGRREDADPGIQHDPILALETRQLSVQSSRTALLALLWGASALVSFGLSIPAFAAAYHQHQANALIAGRQYSHASDEYLRAMSLSRISSEISAGFDWALTHQDVHIDTVLGNAQEKVQRYPALAAAHNDFASILMAHKEVDRAIEEYRRALALKPGYAIAHSNLALALQMRHQMKGAEAEFHQAIALEPENPAFRYNLARAYAEENNLPQALIEYRTSIGLRPDFVPSYLPLASILHKTGRNPEALATLQKLVREMQSDPSYARLTLQVQRTIRDWKDAKSTVPVPAFDSAQ